MANNFNININIAGVKNAIVGIQQLARATGGIRNLAKGNIVQGGGPLGLIRGTLGGISDPRIAAAAAAIVGVVAVAATSIRAFVHVVDEGASQLAQLTAARTLTGGTLGQVAALAATGLGGDLASVAAGLRARLGTDPFAMMAGVNAGLSPQLPRPFGSQNEAATLTKAIEALRAMGEGEAQLRQARMLGLDSLLPLINVSKEMAAAQKQDAAVRQKIVDQFGPAGREFNAAIARLTFNFGTLLQAISGPMLGKLTGFINYLADSLLGLASFFSANPQLGSAIADAILTPLRAILIFAELTGSISKGSTAQFEAYVKAGQAQVSALNKNTAATWSNTQAWKSGMYGGGARAQAGIPNSLRGYALQRAIQGNSLRLGAITP